MPAKHSKSHRRFYGRTRELKQSRRMSRAAGLPPGTLIHLGDQKAERAEINVISYNEKTFTEERIDDIAQFTCEPKEGVVHWINVDGLHDVGVIRAFGDCFGIHPLVLEDILNTGQRPKLEDYGEYVYIVFKMLYFGNGNGGGHPGENGNGHNEIISEQVSLILTANTVISFQECPGADVFNPIRDHIRHSKGRLRKEGVDYLAYALMDAVVDNYFIILESLGETIDTREEELVTHPTLDVLEQIHALRGEVLGLRRSVWPLREVISTLARGEHPLVRPATLPYLRDLYDHTIQIIDTIEAYRDILAGMMDIYLSSASNRLNEIMKVLTMFSTLFIPLTFIVGIYGMNFKFMPELDKSWGYPMVWGIMLAITAATVWFFKRRRWF